MRIDFIHKKLNSILNSCGTRDPFEIISLLGILLLYEPMGAEKTACKGFFMKHSRIKSITINSSLSEKMQRLIAAHELGHAVLHSSKAKIDGFNDFALFSEMNSSEYEANVFAAELLIPDEYLIEGLKNGKSIFQIAAALSLPDEIMDFKIRAMKKRGYKIEPQLNCRANFLKG